MNIVEKLEHIAPGDDHARLAFFERALELRRGGMTVNQILESLGTKT